MRPILLDLTTSAGHLTLPTYTAFIVLGGLAVIVIGAITAGRRGLPFRASLLLLLIALAAEFVGARAMHRIANPSFYAGHPGLVYTFSRIGLSVYGGLILAALVVPIACRLVRANLWRLADSVAPALGIGIAIARVGCFLNGCCCGKPTSLPWGVLYPMGSPAYFGQFGHSAIGLFDSPRPVHPTQLYEALAAVGCVILAAWLMRRKLPDGIAFAAFVATFTGFRWFNFHLLAEKDVPGNAAWLYPALYAAVILVCAVVTMLRLREPVDRPDAISAAGG
jgi:phosphatidylglycerol---prolipoprotein diacylglyceryl transferase